MGQKTHPYGFRLGITKPWRSRWFAKRDYSRLLHEDLKLKRDLKKQLGHAGVSNIEVERMAQQLRETEYPLHPFMKPKSQEHRHELHFGGPLAGVVLVGFATAPPP